MLTRSHGTMTSFKRSSSRRRSPIILDKSTSLPRHRGDFSEKSGECGASRTIPDITDRSRGCGVSPGGLRKSPRSPDEVSDEPNGTSNRENQGESGRCCISGNGLRKSPRLNCNIKPDGVSDVPSENSNQEDRHGSVGYGISGSGLRKSPRLNCNVKPGGASNVPSLNSNQEELGGSEGRGILGVVARKSPRLNGGNKTNMVSKAFVRVRKSPRLNGGDEPNRVYDALSGDGNCRGRGTSKACGNLGIVVRRSPRLIRCVKPLNPKDGHETTLKKVLVNEVVNDARQHCGDAVAETTGNSRPCVLGLTLSSAMVNNKEHGQYNKTTMIKGSDNDHSPEEWTSEQLAALQGAYLLAKPTPHFWKKVSKLVPGKSAKECFDKIHSEHVTPPQTRLRSRVPKTSILVEDQCQLSASKILKSPKPLVKKPIKKRKIHLAHKMVRQLIKKQSSLIRNREADFFSILEPNLCSSPEVPGTLLSTPENLPRAGGLHEKFREESSSGKKKPLSRFHSSTGTDLTSPPVLKQVKNVALHEKYLDHLHNRDAKRRKLEPPGGANKVKVGENVDVVGAAKNALILDATDAIKQFQLTAAYDRSLCTEIEDDGFLIKDDDEEMDMLSDAHRH